MPRITPLLSSLLISSVLAGAALAESPAVQETAAEEAAEAAAAAALTVQVSGLAEVSGHLFIALYDSKDTWLGEDTVLLRKVVIEEHRNGELVEVGFDLAAGQYAMTVFYDADDNGELNTNFIGMPKEPIALSNNATGKFGPPKYEDALFEIATEPVLQLINMEEL